MRRGIPYERLNLMWVVCYAAVALLGVRLLHVQVIRNVYYSRVAESNRTQVIPKAAPRGRIYDRNGTIIATNRPAFSLIYLPTEERDQAYLAGLAENLAKELHQERDEILPKLKEAVREESAIHLAENLPFKTMFKLSELKTIYPGVDLIVEARRYYPKGAFAGHLLGYIGKMDKRSWRKLKGLRYRVDAWIGRSGLEKSFERELRGVDGGIRMEVDAQGHLKRRLGESSWTPGGNLHLTIDADIQQALEEGIRRSPPGQGAGVVLDPRSGEILALASLPDYDPNLFLLPEWDENKKKLKDFPAFNRAISGLYAPASTFKIVTSAAIIEDGNIDLEKKVRCPGYAWLGRRKFRCWGKHGLQDWLGGITHSCDVYFYKTGLRAGGAAIEAMSKQFGLGRKTGVELEGEKSGQRAGPAARKKKGQGWYDGDTYNLAIGQGELLVTPIQMAVLVAAVANDGTLWRPHFIRKIEFADGRVRTQEPEVMGRVAIKPETWELLHEGLQNVVRRGTGRIVNIRQLVVGGKTGTAQNPHGDDHAWFVAYAGREGEVPSLALSVLVQHGGHGASAAGPVARRVIKKAFGL